MGHIFMTAANAVLPIVLLIVLGYLLRQKGVLTDQFLSVGNKLVFSVCLPVMMFVNVYGIASISDVRWDICLYSVAAVTLLFLLGIVLVVFYDRRFAKKVETVYTITGYAGKPC